MTTIALIDSQNLGSTEPTATGSYLGSRHRNLARDLDGNFWVAISFDNGGDQLRIYKSPDGTDWALDTTLTTGSAGASLKFANISVDGDNRIAVVFSMNPNPFAALRLFYAERVAGVWSTPTQLFSVTPNNFGGQQIAAVFDDDNKIHILYEFYKVAGLGSKSLVYATDESGSFVTSTLYDAADTQHGPRMVSLTCDPQGNLHIVYYDGNSVADSFWKYLRKDKGQPWGDLVSDGEIIETEFNHTTPAEFYSASLQVHTDGKVHIVLHHGHTGTDERISYTRRDGANNFLALETVINPPSNNPCRCPQISVALNGDIYISFNHDLLDASFNTESLVRIVKRTGVGTFATQYEYDPGVNTQSGGCFLLQQPGPIVEDVHYGVPETGWCGLIFDFTGGQPAEIYFVNPEGVTFAEPEEEEPEVEPETDDPVQDLITQVAPPPLVQPPPSNHAAGFVRSKKLAKLKLPGRRKKRTIGYAGWKRHKGWNAR
jgi:hypothetical protein